MSDSIGNHNGDERPPEINGNLEWRKYEIVKPRDCTIEGLPGQVGYIKVEDGKLMSAARKALNAPSPWLLLLVPIFFTALLAGIKYIPRVCQASYQVTAETERAVAEDKKTEKRLESDSVALEIFKQRTSWELNSMHDDIRQIGRAVGARGLSRDSTTGKPQSNSYEPYTR